MPGGVVQIVAVGPHDELLSKDPMYSFFESSYVTYEMFAIESIDQTGSGVADFNKKVTYEVTKNADLVMGALLEITLPAITPTGTNATVSWIHMIAIYILTKVYVDIGGQTIDTHYPQYMDFWSRLSIPEGKRFGWNEMVGETNVIQSVNGSGVVTNSVNDSLQVQQTSKSQTKVLLPLRFWFCENPGNALPIGTLLFNTVRITCEFRDAASCYILGSGTLTTPSLVDCRLFVDYVFLDKDARERFAADEHFYVINQVQFTGAESVSAATANIRLNYNMPVTELIWGVQEDGAVASGVSRWDFYDQYASNTNLLPLTPLTNAVLKLNGQDRFSTRTAEFFMRYQPFKHHSNIPKSRGIFVYSFALYPEDLQPSGSCNFSRIDNASLNLTFVQIASGVPGKVYIFARNINFLKIKKGYAGVLFSS
jgi:hypothetical protein